MIIFASVRVTIVFPLQDAILLEAFVGGSNTSLVDALSKENSNELKPSKEPDAPGPIKNDFSIDNDPLTQATQPLVS